MEEKTNTNATVTSDEVAGDSWQEQQATLWNREKSCQASRKRWPRIAGSLPTYPPPPRRPRRPSSTAPAATPPSVCPPGANYSSSFSSLPLCAVDRRISTGSDASI